MASASLRGQQCPIKMTSPASHSYPASLDRGEYYIRVQAPLYRLYPFKRPDDSLLLAATRNLTAAHQTNNKLGPAWYSVGTPCPSKFSSEFYNMQLFQKWGIHLYISSQSLALRDIFPLHLDPCRQESWEVSLLISHKTTRYMAATLELRRQFTSSNGP